MVLYSKIKKIFSKNNVEKTEKEAEEIKSSTKQSERNVSLAQNDNKPSETTDKEMRADLSRQIGTKNAHQILLKPLISEKSSILAEDNKYCFLVHPLSNKSEVKKAVQAVYGVNPVKVNIINLEGKKVRFGRRNGKRKSIKKAVVVLPKGKKLEIYEGV